MTNNEVLQRIQSTLKLSNQKIIQIFGHAQHKMPLLDLQNYLKDEEEPGYLPCADPILSLFLNGLIIERRGPHPKETQLDVDHSISNNIVLKKLRVAFAFKDVDIVQILQKAGFPVSKSEIGALCRRPDHPNFKKCEDQFLRNFIRGLPPIS